MDGRNVIVKPMSPMASGATDAPSEVAESWLQLVAHCPDIDPALVGKKIGPYYLQRLVGVGGMGVVYQALDERLDRIVALKIIRDPRRNTCTAQPSMLWQEAQCASRVIHPNVATIFDVGTVEDGEKSIVYMVMEYIDGQTLRHRMRGKTIGRRDANVWSATLISAVAAAHQVNVIHGDLKPENILISQAGQLKVLDFGLSHLDGDTTRAAHQGGTPGYLAPEQIPQGSKSFRSDVYALGLVIYELFSRGHRYDANNHFYRHIPWSVRGIVRKSLQSERQLRFADAQALLQAWQGRRRTVRVIITAVALLLLFLLLLMGSAVWRADLTQPRPLLGMQGAHARVTAHVRQDSIATLSISPDGNRIAYLAPSGLYVKHTPPHKSQAHHVVIDQHTPLDVSWFFDSQSLLVVTSVDARAPMHLIRVFLTKSTSEIPAHPQTLWRAPDMTAALPSPNGRHIVFVQGDTSLNLLDLATNQTKLLWRVQNGHVINNIAWSKSGEGVAFIDVDMRVTQAAIMTLSLRQPRPKIVFHDVRLVQELGRSGLAYTDDGLVFPLAEKLPHEPGSRLWLLPTDASGEVTGPLQPITKVIGAFATQFSASRSDLAYVRVEAQTDVYVADIESAHRSNQRLANIRRLTETDRNERLSGWTVDGRILFFSNQFGTYDLFTQSVSQRQPQPLVVDQLIKTWAQIVQPKPGVQQLYYWGTQLSDQDQGHQVQLLQYDHNRTQVIHRFISQLPLRDELRPGPLEKRFQCATTNARCIISELKNGELIFSDLPLKTPVWRVALAEHTNTAVGWSLSPDGTQIALPAGSNIMCVDLSSQKIQSISAASDCRLQDVAFQPDGAAFYASAVCDSTSPYQILRIDRAGTVDILWQSASDWVATPIPSPDGHHLAFTVKTIDTDAWIFRR